MNATGETVKLSLNASKPHLSASYEDTDGVASCSSIWRTFCRGVWRRSAARSWSRNNDNDAADLRNIRRKSTAKKIRVTFREASDRFDKEL